jgi:tetratricopeptide (TPR) repeat protein
MESKAAELVNRGVDRWEAGNLDEAITLFTEAIAADPTLSEAYYNRGNAHAARGDQQDAIADYTTALELKPRYAPVAYVYYNRALAYAKIGKDDLAIADYTQAIKGNPQFAEAYFNRAIAVERAHKDHEKAIADFTRAVDLNHGFSEAFNNRGAVYLAIDDFISAIADFSRAAKLTPTATAPRQNLEIARAAKENARLDLRGKIVVMQI